MIFKNLSIFLFFIIFAVIFIHVLILSDYNFSVILVHCQKINHFSLLFFMMHYLQRQIRDLP